MISNEKPLGVASAPARAYAAAEAQPTNSSRPRPLKFPSNNDPATASTPRALELRKQAQDRPGQYTIIGASGQGDTHVPTQSKSSSDSLLPPSPTSHSSSGTFEAIPIGLDANSRQLVAVDRSHTVQRAGPGTETPPEVWHALHQSESSMREQPRRHNPTTKEANQAKAGIQSARVLVDVPNEFTDKKGSTQSDSRIHKKATDTHPKGIPESVKPDFQKDAGHVSMELIEDRDLTVLNTDQLEFVDKFVPQKKAEEKFTAKKAQDKETPELDAEQQDFVDKFARQKEALRLENFEIEEGHSNVHQKSSKMGLKGGDAAGTSSPLNADNAEDDNLLVTEKIPSKREVANDNAKTPPSPSSKSTSATAPISGPPGAGSRRQRQEEAAASKMQKLRENEEKVDHKRFQEETRLAAEIEFQAAETKREQELAEKNNAKRAEQRQAALKTKIEGRDKSAKHELKNTSRADKEKKKVVREATKGDFHHDVSHIDQHNRGLKDRDYNLSQRVMTAAGQNLFNDSDDCSARTLEGLASNSGSSGSVEPGLETGLITLDNSLAEHMDGLLSQINYRRNTYNFAKEKMLWYGNLYSVSLSILLVLSTCLSLLAASGYVSTRHKYYTACVVSGICAAAASCVDVLRDMQEVDKKAKCFEEAESMFRALALKLRANCWEVRQGHRYCSRQQHVLEAFILKYETIYEEILAAQNTDTYHVDPALVLDWVASRKLTDDEEAYPLYSDMNSTKSVEASQPSKRFGSTRKVNTHNSRKLMKQMHADAPHGYSMVQDHAREDSLESGKSSMETQEKFAGKADGHQWSLLSGLNLKEYTFTDMQDERYLQDIRRLLSQVYVRKNLLVLVAQKRDSIDLLRFKLPIELLIASTFIISFLATSSSMIDTRYKLNLAAGLISIISQVWIRARHNSLMGAKADMARRAGKRYSLLGTKLERLLGEHRSASSMLGATNDSSSDPTDSFMKKVAAERAKFMGSCVRAVELLQSTVEQLQDRSADALLRSHDTIVGKWLDGGDILPHRGDYPEYAPNLMTQKYVLAALFLNDPP